MYRNWFVSVLCATVVALQFASPSQASWVTDRINLNRYGLQSNGGSWAPSMSADGKYVAWHSWATDLVVGDTDGVYDIYVRDWAQGVSYLVSRTSAGGLSNGVSTYPDISADGLSVAFSSLATNLVPGDTNGVQDIFVTDWTVSQIERVSVSSDGTEANGASEHAAISGDGRFVAFDSVASNLVPGGRSYRLVYLHDRLNQTTECVSVSSTGAVANNVAYRPTISPDGRYVGFTSAASNLVPDDTNGTRDAFLRDRLLGTTERISIADQTGAQGNADSSGARPAITPDGRYVAFTSVASNLVADDTNGLWDVFVRDRVNGTTQRVSVSTAGVQGNGNSGADSYVLAVSDDGRYVEFCSGANNLVTGDTNGVWDTFVRDRQSGTTERQSVSSTGTQAEVMAGYYGLDLSADGSLRVFDSHANHLVPNDTSICINTFLHYWVSSPVVAAFSARPTSGIAPLTVQFTDASSGNPTSWAWSFGDGATSTDRNPAHQYTAPGSFTVTLTVSNGTDSNTATKTGYIVVKAPHLVSVTASALPTSIASGGTTNLSATVTDSQGHTGFAYAWSDNGAGGTFSPSATVRNPTYTAPPNTSGSDAIIALTVTATCKWYYPWVSATATVNVTEATAPSALRSVGTVGGVGGRTRRNRLWSVAAP